MGGLDFRKILGRAFLVLLILLAFPDVGVLAWERAFGRLLVVARPLGELQANCFLLSDTRTGEGVLIDPGDEKDTIVSMVGSRVTRLLGVLLTHGHGDHCGAAREVAGLFSCPIFVHPGDGEAGAPSGLGSYVPLKPGDVLKLGGGRLKVLPLPGHSPGSVGFLVEPGFSDEDRDHDAASGSLVTSMPSETERLPSLLFAGDTVFANGVGRTWGKGDEKQMLEGINAWVLPLPDSTIVFPGHGFAAVLGKIRPWLEELVSGKAR